MKKTKNNYVLFDTQNKGRAIATKYTILQLLEKGCEIIGVMSTSPFKVTYYTQNGEISKRSSSFEDVAYTKKSATSFIKGIKQSSAKKLRRKKFLKLKKRNPKKTI